MWTPSSAVSSPHGELAREVHEALTPQTGGRVVSPLHRRHGGGRPQDRRPPLLQQLGITFAILRTDALYGLVNGEQVLLGRCEYNGRPLLFDVWVPHFGMAFDIRTPDRDERQAKARWCRTHGVIYSWAHRSRDERGLPKVEWAILRPDDGEEEVVGIEFLKAALAARRGGLSDG